MVVSELGQEVGVNRVVEVIKAENPDVIEVVEKPSSRYIADALGYYFYLRSSNLSIMSRYPITDTYDLYDLPIAVRRHCKLVRHNK